MASAAVVDHLYLEALPLIDLRLLSQSELYSLSLFSSSSYSSNDNDDVLIPKIDRSVFNESAGSRKQTYSRLRLAPRKPQSTSTPSPTRTRTPAPFSSTPRQIPEPLDEENSQIISILKQLFAAQASTAENPATADDDDKLVSVRVEFEDALPDWWSAGFQNVPIDVVPGAAGDGGGEQKRKRGRPRKNENWRIEPRSEHKAEPNVPVDVVVSEGEKKRKRGRPRKEENPMIDSRQSEREMAVAEEKEMVMVNKKGDMEDVAALANVEDPYGEELKRRTEGLQTEAELLEFLSVLPGESMNRSRKRRIVLASDFGHALPEGWKLMLTVKKRASRVWLHCRRYISPNGHQFVSCKEVSSYLLSFFGLQDANQPRSGHIDENVQLSRKMDRGDDAALKLEDGKNADDLVSRSPLPMTSILTDYAKQDTLKTGDPVVHIGEILKCDKCTITFDEKNDLARHLITGHNNGVIIKDGKYECELCHKIFDERQQYNGHFGVHVPNYVKSVDTSGEVISKQKHVDPALARVLLSTSKMHKSIGIDGAKTSIEAIDELSSGFSHGLIKADTIIKTCGDVDSHALVLLSHDKETIKADKNDQALVEEHSDKRDKICDMNSDNLGKVDVATVVVDRWNACSVNETASINESRSICESSYERNLHKGIHSGINSNVAESSFESRSLAPPGNERTFAVENNAIKVFFPAVEEPKPQIGSESGLLALNGKDKTCSGEDIDGYTFENNESVSAFGNHDSGLKDLCPNVKRQCSSEGFSLFPYKNEQRSTLANKWSGILSSSMLESVQERGFGSVLCNSSTDEKTCVVRGNLNYVCTGTLDEPRFDEVNISGNNVISVGFGSNLASQNDKAVTSGEQEGSSGSCLLISSCNEQCVVENTNKSPSWTLDGPFQGKTFESHMFASSVNEQKSRFGNNMNKASTSAVEGLKLDDVSNRKNLELNIAFDRNETGVDADTTACSQQERCFKGSLPVLSADEHRYVLKDFDICNSTLEELKQARGVSERGLLRQSGYEQNHDNINNVNKVSGSSIEEAEHKKVKSFWDTEVFLSFGTHEGMDEDVTCTMQGPSSEGCSLVLSGNEQTFSTDNKVTDVYSSTVGELKHERGSKNSFPCPSAFDQIENKLNGVCMSRVWEWHRSEDMEKPRDDAVMIDFEDLAQSNENSVAEPMWRTTEQNIQPSGLANTSSPLVESSGCFPLFDVMSSKGGDKFFSANERFDRKSGLDGLRSSRTGNPEHNFLTSQGSSQPEESKVLSYDVEMEDLDSSYWLKKEALPLLPKLAGRHQVRTMCVWCRNEFYLESVNSEMQSGSVGFMCATCNAKYSRQWQTLVGRQQWYIDRLVSLHMVVLCMSLILLIRDCQLTTTSVIFKIIYDLHSVGEGIDLGKFDVDDFWFSKKIRYFSSRDATGSSFSFVHK